MIDTDDRALAVLADFAEWNWLDDDAPQDILLEIREAIEHVRRRLAQPDQSEPVGTVCLLGDRYAHGCMIEAQLQIEPGAELPIGTKLYTHPDRTQATGESGVPEPKYPDDGNGDDDAYNAGWNACRAAMLAAAGVRDD